MKLFLDDVRHPLHCFGYMAGRIGEKSKVYLDSWEIVRNFDEFKDAVESFHGQIELVSFDHDLSVEHYDHSMMVNPNLMEAYYNKEDREKTGYDCAVWMKEFYERQNTELPKIMVHSMNPVGTANITNVFQ